MKLTPTLQRALAFAALGVATLVVGSIDGLGTALLVLAGGTLLLTISLFWSSIQDLSGESELTLDEALGMAAPSAEEERKRSVLRALKDLEYERSVGNISEEDYADLSARYRAEAKRLLQALDEEQAALREKAEKALARRLSDQGLDGSKNRHVEPEPAPDADEEPGDEAPESGPKRVAPVAAKTKAAGHGPTRRCAACEQRNDLDAQFCKRCGAAMAGKGELLCSACPAVYDAALDACPECGVARPVALASADDEDNEEEREAT